MQTLSRLSRRATLRLVVMTVSLAAVTLAAGCQGSGRSRGGDVTSSPAMEEARSKGNDIESEPGYVE